MRRRLFISAASALVSSASVAVILAGSVSASGCARRARAYQFRAPLVSSVHTRPVADPLFDSSFDSSGEPDGDVSRGSNPVVGAPGDTPSAVAARPVQPAVDGGFAAGARSGAGTDVRPDVQDLPSPHRAGADAAPQQPTREPTAVPVAGDPGSSGFPPLTVADLLRARVGRRDKQSTDVAFVHTLLSEAGVSLGASAHAVSTGSELLALATERSALTKDTPLTGDLVVFDRVDGATEASLVGVVVGVVPRDQLTVEFIFLGRGVVRRGYVTPSRPTRKRDDQGRALNTFVRALTGKAKKSDPFLAGQLFRSFVRIDRLTD